MAEVEKSLVERAEMLTNKVQKVAGGSVGMMLGADGRTALQELAGLVEGMARELDRREREAREAREVVGVMLGAVDLSVYLPSHLVEKVRELVRKGGE